MRKIGITGQSGFIGSHLYNTFGLFQEKFLRIPFKDAFFQDEMLLQNFVNQCDVIVHLAAVNRHSDPETLYTSNIKLVQQIILACEATGSRPHIIFSSSTQEDRENQYGKSKKEGRKLLEQWAYRNKAQFTGVIIPNVYGPFGQPFYNSVIATFCHQLTHDEQPKIDIDAELKLIYIGELVNHIINIVENTDNTEKNRAVINRICLEHTYEAKVSNILLLLTKFQTAYFQSGEIPNLNDTFERNIFNTFICYIDHLNFFPFKLVKNTDQRGSFVEIIKLSSGGQISFSTTTPGVTRGNHFHTRKAERFVVLKGKAKIEIRRIGTEKSISFELDGDNPSFVDMPIWYTHNITNIGTEELYTLFWINEQFNFQDPDTWFEKV